MPRPKTPYYPPLPPPRIKPNSLLRKFFSGFTGGKHGALRFVLLTAGVVGIVDAAVLLDVYVFRPQLYPRRDPLQYQKTDHLLTYSDLWESFKGFFDDSKSVDQRDGMTLWRKKGD